MSEFKSFIERDLTERLQRAEDFADLMPFGIPFLDVTLTGLLPTDVVLIGAGTGVGKTEILTTIGGNLATMGKNVYFFALEAEEGEIERRRKFCHIMELYHRDGGTEPASYQEWRMSKLPFLFDYENKASAMMERYATFHTYYRQREFTLQMFENLFAELEGKADAVLLDHCQMFHIEGENENKGISDIMLKIKDMSQILRIPVILVSHLKKISKKEKTLLFDISDFHGSSNLSKIATRVVALANGGIEPTTGHTITYLKILKNRLGSERTHFVGKTLYDTKKNAYIEKVKWGFLSADEKEWIELFPDKLPHWLRD
jgi:hypothetical protein